MSAGTPQLVAGAIPPPPPPAHAAETIARVTGARRRRTRRSLLIGGALTLALVTAACLGLWVGTDGSFFDAIGGLLGVGGGGDTFIMQRIRGPRVGLAIMVGAAFGISGALLQTIARNPLASPDILGISGGASIGAVAALLVFGASGGIVVAAAFGGAALAAVAIVVFAWRGGIGGYRFVLIGIAIAFLGAAIVNFLLSRTRVEQAQVALVWIVGSVSGARAADLVLIGVALLVLVPAAILLSRRLSVLQLGDDASRSLGVGADATRLLALAVAVGLAASATSVAGPVAFVAFVSAPIARALIGNGRIAIVPSALVGAALVTTADLVGQHLLPGGINVPVGIVTAAVGAPYLLALLAFADRKKSR